MNDRIDREAAMRMATEVLTAYLSRNAVAPEALPALIRQVRDSLWPELAGSWDESPVPHRDQGASEAPSEAAAPVRKPTPDEIAASIKPNYLVSFEDGRPYRTLRRHLMAKHGLTAEQYREKWGLPHDYPMVAPSYAKTRSEVAKRTGLGKNRPGRAILSGGGRSL